MRTRPDLTDERYLATLIAEETALLRDRLARTTDAGGAAGDIDALVDYLAATNVRLSVVEQLLASDSFLREKAESGRRAPVLLPASALGNSANLYPVEKGSDGLPQRWTGPASRTSLALLAPRNRRYELAIRVSDQVSRSAADHTRVTIDGRPVSHIVRHYYGGDCIICTLPRRRDSIAATRIDLEVMDTAVPAGGDRPQGIAIREIRVSYRLDPLRRLLRYLHWQKFVGRLRR